jgi:KipI family sensor histidine kinase inhibitor
VSGAGSAPPTIRPLAESGLLVELGDTIEPATTAQVMALTGALDAAALPGVLDVVPSYTTVLVAFDPEVADWETLAAGVRRLCADLGEATTVPARGVEIPVAYGGELGPDLANVAAHTGLAPEEVVARHAAAEYVVACMGFAPGFAFLAGLPPALATPRLAQPRTRVPAGSVGIGGAQTGVYPMATPGGWRLIGRTPLRLFDLARAEPFLLRPGDRVRFAPIDAAAFRELDPTVSVAVSPDRHPARPEGGSRTAPTTRLTADG